MRFLGLHVVGLGLSAILVSGQSERRRLGKKHGGHGGHGGEDQYVPVRTSSTMLTDPHTYQYGLPPMEPFPEQTMMLSSQETVLPGYEQYDQESFMLGGLENYGHHGKKNKHQQEWQPMEAHYPEVVHPQPMPFKGKSAAPIKGATLPPIMPPPPPPAPIIQPQVVHKYAEPPPVESKKSKHGEGHGGGHGGKKHGEGGHGGHGGKKRGKKHHDVPEPQPIVVVIPQKHVKQEIPPPPQKHVPSKHDHMDHGHMGGPGMGSAHDHTPYGIGPHGDEPYIHGGGSYGGASYGGPSPFTHGMGRTNEYVIPPYGPSEYHRDIDMDMGPTDWVPVGTASPYHSSSYGGSGGASFHDSGYRVVSKANDALF